MSHFCLLFIGNFCRNFVWYFLVCFLHSNSSFRSHVSSHSLFGLLTLILMWKCELFPEKRWSWGSASRRTLYTSSQRCLGHACRSQRTNLLSLPSSFLRRDDWMWQQWLSYWWVFNEFCLFQVSQFLLFFHENSIISEVSDLTDNFRFIVEIILYSHSGSTSVVLAYHRNPKGVGTVRGVARRNKLKIIISCFMFHNSWKCFNKNNFIDQHSFELFICFIPWF